MNAPDKRDLDIVNVFVRQPFTECDTSQSRLIQSVLDLIHRVAESSSTTKLNVVTGAHAESAASFKAAFSAQTGAAFTPRNFRRHRLALLDDADVMLVIRTGLSESSAFEVAYSVLRAPNRPIFFAVHESCPIRTTLLQELDELAPVVYVPFAEADDLVEPLIGFLGAVIAARRHGSVLSRDSAVRSAKAHRSCGEPQLA